MNYYKKVGKRILVFIITLLALYIAFKLSIFYIPFLIAFIISLIIEPLIRKIMKLTNLTRKISAIIALILVFLGIIALLAWGLTSIVTEASNILRNLNGNMEVITSKIQKLVLSINLNNIRIPEQLTDIINSSFSEIIREGKNILQEVLNKTINIVTHIPKIMIYVGITLLATYFVCTDKMYILDQMEHHLPRNWVNKFGIKLRKVISSLGDYLKAQGILILISFSIVLVGLLVLEFIGMNIEYPLIMALVIGLVDALPILGAGTIVIPWSVIVAFNGDIKLAIALIILYVIVIIVKQLIEPKIVSNHIGIHPIFTLIAMYTGFKIIGIIGIFMGPIILIILKNIFETMIDNGVVKTILDRK